MRANKRATWSFLRSEIEQARHRLNLSERQFRPLSITEWSGLEEQIYQRFCQLTNPVVRPTWMWSCLKQDSAWLPSTVEDPMQVLSTLIPADEYVWLLLNETVNENVKYWFYEGEIGPIVQVLMEACGVDEVILVSKRLEWLVCLNHHDALVASGKNMPTRLRALM